jgi:tRNA-dihydrouridine synthase C
VTGAQAIAATPGDGGTFLALAPMDGITCAVYREVITSGPRESSGLSLCVTEFVRVTANAVPPSVLRREVPELGQGGLTASGVPIAVQLLGSNLPAMAETARRAAELGAKVVDLNFGCPAKTVNNHDGGASLLRAPCRVQAVVAAVREAVPQHVPVSAKIRLGWSDATHVEELARAAEQGGASWLTIHARTRAQGYAPPVDWAAIGRAREAIAIPVVANGDLCSPEDVAACRAQSGCSAFMIGRAAMADPWLFRRLREDDTRSALVEAPPRAQPMPREALTSMLHRYVILLQARGATARGALGKLKQWLRLGAAIRRELARDFEHIKRCSDLDEAARHLWPTAWNRGRAA